MLKGESGRFRFSVHHELVGLSGTTSWAEKPDTVSILFEPTASVPTAPLLAKSNKNPFAPYDNDDKSLGIKMPSLVSVTWS